MSARIVNPPDLAAPVGYSHGILTECGRLLFLGGQVGWDAEERMEEDFIRQFARALGNMIQVLRAAGGEPGDIVQMRIYVLDRAEYVAARREIGEIWRGLMGRHYPAMTLLVVAGLLEPGARVEIEGVAVLPAAPPR